MVAVKLLDDLELSEVARCTVASRLYRQAARLLCETQQATAADSPEEEAMRRVAARLVLLAERLAPTCDRGGPDALSCSAPGQRCA